MGALGTAILVISQSLILLVKSQLGIKICPPDFTTIDGNICVLHVQIYYDYCPATWFCTAEGYHRGVRLFLPGRNAVKMLPYFPQVEVFYTSITAFLNQSVSLNGTWSVGDPGYAGLTISANQLSAGYRMVTVNSSVPNAIAYSNSKLRTDFPTFPSCEHIICELSEKTEHNFKERFLKNWPVAPKTWIQMHGTTSNCFNTLYTPTLLGCGLKCKLRIHCRALYYDRKSGVCWFAMHVDSLLPRGKNITDGDWIRFGRPDW